MKSITEVPTIDNIKIYKKYLHYDNIKLKAYNKHYDLLFNDDKPTDESRLWKFNNRQTIYHSNAILISKNYRKDYVNNKLPIEQALELITFLNNKNQS